MSQTEQPQQQTEPQPSIPIATQMSREEMEHRLADMARQIAAMQVQAAPVSFKREPFAYKAGRHYCPVERAHSGNPETALPRYMSMGSPTRPGELMYTIETDDPAYTGSVNVTLLSCTLEDYLETLRLNELPARGYMVRPPTPDFRPGMQKQQTESIREEEFVETDTPILSHLVR